MNYEEKYVCFCSFYTAIEYKLFTIMHDKVMKFKNDFSFNTQQLPAMLLYSLIYSN